MFYAKTSYTHNRRFSGSYPFGLDTATSEYAGAQGTARWGMSKLKHDQAKGWAVGCMDAWIDTMDGRKGLW